MKPQRVRSLRESGQIGVGPVVYWMSREQRAEDNWPLLYAQQQALAMQRPLQVVFCLADHFLGATLRHYGFMLRGLSGTFRELSAQNIGAVLLRGNPGEVLPAWLAEQQAALLVVDFDPLRIKRQWQQEVLAATDISCHQVDGHNIVPCWVASAKLEYAAYTFRPKLQKLLPEYLDPLPRLAVHPYLNRETRATIFDPITLLAELPLDRSVPESDRWLPGSRAAQDCLEQFLTAGLETYDRDRNDPCKEGQSNLSPYLHFGQLAPQRVVLEVLKTKALDASAEALLEELTVRRELADNFCYYQTAYDQVEAFTPWACRTLEEHHGDRREFLYSFEEFDCAKTHDALWNAAQRQMVVTGKMHGYLRMYWAKKILEWSASPVEAMQTAIALNDRYELDGRDPNGYAGIAWSIGGVHDRAWGERPIFGKIRTMTGAGMKRKFDVEKYIRHYLH